VIVVVVVNGFFVFVGVVVDLDVFVLIDVVVINV
jgi:hypothetical protein